jgi:broad specificity phosphatase PhoE
MEAARALAARLEVDAVVSSPEPKALATARAFGAPVEVDERLREHERAGMPFLSTPSEFERAVARGFARPGEVVLGSESFDAARERFAAGVADASREHPEGRLAIVSHGTVIALYAARAWGADALAVWRGLALPDVLELRR